MCKSRTYTVKQNTHYSSAKNHRLIRAACAKGLKNVTITWHPKENVYEGREVYPGRGWWLVSDGLPPRHIGCEVAEAENRINQIKVK